MDSTRAGRYVTQPTGYRAFVPSPLPPIPALDFTKELITDNSYADRMLARLDAAADFMPNPALFIYMHALREAVLSSQIEGTQSSLDDLLKVEANLAPSTDPDDADETFNYQQAMDRGLELLKELPVSLCLIREIHGVLLQGVQGQEKQPGEFRRSQNWIGHSGSTLNNAAFVPPFPSDMMTALGDLENFIHSTDSFPPLIKSALVHAQFETIHPFLDGNGRVGRLLITFLLVETQVLRQPLLYPSLYFKQHRTTYYDLLQNVRDKGEWEAWVRFFLIAIAESAKDGYERILRILKLREGHRALVSSKDNTGRMLRVLEWLYRYPYTTISSVATVENVTFPTASNIVQRLEQFGILQETTGRNRDREFVYQEYMAILRQETVGG